MTTQITTIQIRNRWTGSILFEGEFPTTRAAVIGAIARGTDLRDTNLSGTDLSGTNLRGTDLSGTDLRDADLSGTDLRGTNLRGTNLRGTDLSGADLSGADLSGTDLSGADLSGTDLSDANLSGTDLSGTNLSGTDLGDADLSGADLSDANLRGTNLSGTNLSRTNLGDANLGDAKADFRSLLMAAPHEIAALRLALIEGRVDGSVYEGQCACLVGTIANARGVAYTSLAGIEPDVHRPAETLFLAIKKGDAPATNPISAIVIAWIDEILVDYERAGLILGGAR